MQYVGYFIYGVGILITFGWIIGIRNYTKRGTPPTYQTINQTMLFLISLILIPSLSLSPMNLLWLFPSSWLLGALSLVMPLALLSIPGRLFANLVCIGIDWENADLNRIRIEKVRELMTNEGISAEEARTKLINRNEW